MKGILCHLDNKEVYITTSVCDRELILVKECIQYGSGESFLLDYDGNVYNLRYVKSIKVAKKNMENI